MGMTMTMTINGYLLKSRWMVWRGIVKSSPITALGNPFQPAANNNLELPISENFFVVALHIPHIFPIFAVGS